MESGIESAMLLVRRSASTGTWSFYSRVWQEWESLLSELPGIRGDFENGLLYFIGLNFGR